MIDNYKPPLFDKLNILEWKKYLEEEGYVVIKDILDKKEIEIGLELFWKDLSYVSPKFERNNSKSWCALTCPIMFGKGIAVFNNLGQSDFCWYIRLQKNIIDIFKNIHNTDDLKTSFDGF